MSGIAVRPATRVAWLVAALATACLLAVGAGPAGATPVRSTSGQPEVTVLATGLQIPWDIAFLPDGRALVTERPGRVRIMTADGRLLPTPAAQVPVDLSGDGGLLGVAVDPQFASGQPFVYLSLDVGGELRVQRFRMTGDALIPEAVVLGGIIAGADEHDSGRVRFGPDGALYIGTGDAGVGSRSQAAGSLNGRILRIPAGSYRGDARVTPDVVAMGLRHPQGLAWQPGTGRLWATDHGPSGFDGPSGDDELNAIVPGGNYGWPLKRGADQRPYRSPALLWAKTIAPTSIAFVTQPGSTWTNHALVTALLGKQIRLIAFSGDTVTADQPLFVNAYGRLRAIAEAPDGSLWVGTSNRDQLGTPGPGDDRILRIVPPAAPATPAPTRPARRVCPVVQRAPRRTPSGPLARRVAKSQRVAQLALRRLRAIDARTSGLPAPRACAGGRDSVRATYRQLRITRRIALSALRLHADLSSRLLGKQVRVPAATLTLIGSGRTPATPRQVLRAERIAQSALRRANALGRAVRRRG
ncbi:MAG TPA: PQQ-dependent sugar dehydrogenase [Miltoncostaea sp.]|nr:PQQ-dependent sugar dehydrogenase [Miltoncostaea sp.]